MLKAEYASPVNFDTIQNCVAEKSNSSLLARGSGLSYGDASISKSSRIICTEKFRRILFFDHESGILRCESGLTFADLMNVCLPQGCFPPVSPGTKHVTMGGALAADIHGKNHHSQGSFIEHVRSFKIISASSELLNCSRTENTDLFWASAGGMGLTGIIAELELSLKKVPGTLMKVKKIRCCNLSETFQMIERHDNDYEYSVAWIDCLATSKNLGRSILILGRHASESENKLGSAAVTFNPNRKAIAVPLDMPSSLLNRYSISAFNSLYYQLSAADGEEHNSGIEEYFYPLDAISNWNRLYGKSGFIQYQCVLPLETSRQGIEEILALSALRGRSSFLAVLKKFRDGHGLLSFPIAGYTLTLDMPVKTGLFEFTAELDSLLIKHGGRVYLAKDACVSAESFRIMYEQLEKWLSIKRAIDPHNRFNSAQSQRLKLY